MKKKKRLYQKIICAAVAFALVVGIISADLFNHAAVAQAKASTFHGMAPYQTTGKNGLSILEITPTADDKDFGYFVNPDPSRDQINQVGDLTYGTLLRPYTDSPDLQAKLQQFRQIKTDAANEANTEAAAAAMSDPALEQKYQEWLTANPWGASQFPTLESWANSWAGGNDFNAIRQQKYNSLYETKVSDKCQAAGLDYEEMTRAENPDMYYAVALRRYGMIKYAGADAVITNGDSKRNAVSEYPIFSDSSYPLFASADIEGNYMLVAGPSGNMVTGDYVINPNNTGLYQLKEGYVLGDGSHPTDAVDQTGQVVTVTLENGYIYKKTLYVDPSNPNGNDADETDDSATDAGTGTDTDAGTGADAGTGTNTGNGTGASGSADTNNGTAETQQNTVQGNSEEPVSEGVVSAQSDVQPETANPESAVNPESAANSSDNGMGVVAAEPNKATVSQNNPGTGTGNVTGEEADDPDTADPAQYIYTRIADGSGLPEGVISVSGGGNLDFNYLPNHPGKYHGYDKEKLYFTTNGDKKYRLGAWIKEYILGDATKNYNISYTNATIDQINNGTYSLDNYDLIYISGRAEEYVAVNGDLSDELVKQIYNASAINHKAVMMDYALYDAENGARNINNLALLLWQNDQKAIVEGNESYFSYDLDDELTGIDNITGILGNATIMNGLQSTRLSGYNGNFAVNNVYVYNHHWSDFQSSKLERFQNDALDVFANGDLISQYTAAATAGGFQSVLAYISYNNTLSVADDNGSMTEGYVTPAIAIQYILSYMGEDLTLAKGKFAVLEIEPTKQFKFNSGMETKDYTLETAEVKAARDEFITKCLGKDLVEKGMQDYVAFTSVTIDQYNTMQTDLIHDYDIVYIGDEFTQYFYTRDEIDTSVTVEKKGTESSGDAGGTGSAGGTGTAVTAGTPGFEFKTQKGTVTAFNTDSMYGNVYYNYGDDVNTQLKKTAQRFASRDLTEAKLTELKNYLLNRGMIVVDEDLMRSTQQGNTIINPTAVGSSEEVYYDHGRIDKSSNMYELFNFAQGRSFDGNRADGDRYQAGGMDENNNPIGRYPNFVSMGDLGVFVNQEDLLVYLNRERISLNLIKQPTAYIYSAGTTPSFIQADNKDGKYYLECEFVIDNSTAIIAAEDVYQIHFYQDVNADGRFTDTEEKLDFEISRSVDDAVISQVMGGDGLTQYNLNNGVAYKLRRAVPADEGGIINWCIKVEKIANKDINCTASGFTAVKPRNVKYLNILQIIPDGEAVTINLEKIMKEQNTELYNLLTDEVVKQNYEITVRTVTASEFQRDTQQFHTNNKDSLEFNALWQKYFSTFQRTNADIYSAEAIAADKDKPMNVNMIILGFGTSEPQFTNSFSTVPLGYFLNTNRPVLVGNNWINRNYMDTEPKSYNYNFLSYFGQDRYGYTDALYNDFYAKNISVSRQEKAEQTEEEKQLSRDVVSKYIEPREAARLAVAYTPGGERGNAYVIPYAYTNTAFARIMRTDANSYSFINAGPVNALTTTNDPTAAASNTLVDRVNDGQVSHYPYTIDDGSGALISMTQAQPFQLDLDRDSDGDGNSDIVVWYTLGDMANGAGGVIPEAGIYSATPGDGINNYYIYNYGNTTFTGFGGRREGNCTTEEKKLFVNTLIAAYEAGLINPTVSYYQTKDPNSALLDSIAVPYDQNVVRDSSVQYNEAGDDYLYKFVNPNTNPATAPDGTTAFFKVQDSNFVRGDKSCHVYFYLGVENTRDGKYHWPNSTQVSDIIPLQLNDNSVVYVVRIPVVIYDADTFSKIGESNPANFAINPRLEVGRMYGMYVPMSYLTERGSAEIYIQADTSYQVVSGSTGTWVDRPLGTAYDMFTLIKQDLLKLD